MWQPLPGGVGSDRFAAAQLRAGCRKAAAPTVVTQPMPNLLWSPRTATYDLKGPMREGVNSTKPQRESSRPVRRSTFRKVATWLVAALLWAGGIDRVAADAVDASTDNPAADDSAPPNTKEDLPPEYRSGAQVKERHQVESRLRRAEDHFSKREWVDGFALLDEVLAEVTSPEHRRRLLLEAAKRRREAEKAARKKAEEENADDGDFAVQAVQLGPGAAGGGAVEIVGDDARSPTVEVYSRDGILYHRVADSARVRLLDLPEAARTLWVRTYESPASEALAAALERRFDGSIGSGSAAALRRIAERYPLTRAGRRAWCELAARLADAGHVAAAAAALDVRLALPFDDGDVDDDGASGLDRAQVLAHAAYLHLFSGHAATGELYLAEVRRSHPDALIPLRGAATLGAAIGDDPLFEKLRAWATERSTPPSTWTAPQSSYAHVAVEIESDALPEIGTELRWLHRLRARKEFERTKDNRAQLYRGTYPVLQLVALDSTIYTRHGADVVAVDLESGEERWRAAIEADYTPTTPNRYAYRSSTRGYEDYSDLGGKSLTLFHDPGRGGRKPRDTIVVVDGTSAADITKSGQATYRGNRLLAFDARSGKRLWSLGGAESERDPLHGLAFRAAPIPAGDVLVAPAIRESGFYIAGVSLDGKLVWLTRLYAFNAAYYQRYGSAMQQSAAVAASNGVVWAAPGDGFVSALDASSGRLLWMTRYKSNLRRHGSGGTHWVHSHPILARDDEGALLIAVPQDSDYITVLDPMTGSLVWEKELGPSQSVLVGCDDERLYVAGTEIRAFAWRTGDEIWKHEPRSSGAGLGFVAGGRLYLPRSGGTIEVLDATTGDETAALTVLDPRVPRGYPFNLFPIDKHLLALGSWGLASILPQSASWQRLDAASDAKRYEKARLLISEREYDKALDIIYDLIGKTRSKGLRRRLAGSLRSTVSRAANESKDPAYIARLLAFHTAEKKRAAEIARDKEPRKAPPPIIAKRADELTWRLREADLLAKKAAKPTLEAYTALLAEDGYTATSPDGNLVDVRIYASDMLRSLRYPEPEADSDSDSDSDSDADADSDADPSSWTRPREIAYRRTRHVSSRTVGLSKECDRAPPSRENAVRAPLRRGALRVGFGTCARRVRGRRAARRQNARRLGRASDTRSARRLGAHRRRERSGPFRRDRPRRADPTRVDGRQQQLRTHARRPAGLAARNRTAGSLRADRDHLRGARGRDLSRWRGLREVHHEEPAARLRSGSGRPDRPATPARQEGPLRRAHSRRSHL